MFSSTERIGLIRWRVLVVIVVVAALTDIALEIGASISFRVKHPAPLGRSASEVTRNLVREFPLGTPADSAVAGLKRRNIDVSYQRGDSTLFGVERKVRGSLIIITDVPFWASVDAGGRVSRWSAKEWYTGP
jgi:hypothetical protein